MNDGMNDGRHADSSQDDKSSIQIDLGSDLIEMPTREVGPLIAPEEISSDFSPEFSNEDPENAIKSAEILLNEGLLEEAKKVLRGVLRKDSHSVAARQMLDAIHDQELVQIFQDRVERRTLRRGTSPSIPLPSSNLIEEISQEPGPVFSLFKDSESMEVFAERLDQEIRHHTPQDRIDLGVGFWEMGLYEVAIHQFKAAYDRARELEVPNFEIERSALCLWAFALIQVERCFEAMINLELMLTDASVPNSEKIELFYLMGRANEKLPQVERALQWYQQTVEIYPTYRDARERLRALLGPRNG